MTPLFVADSEGKTISHLAAASGNTEVFKVCTVSYHITQQKTLLAIYVLFLEEYNESHTTLLGLPDLH